MLNIDVSEVPKKREANISQWLALRNLGLVPVASPETFEWPGRFLGLKRGSSTWAVFFGVPPGIIYDPMPEPDERTEVNGVQAT
jgi:cation transport regulator ChaC